MSITGHLYTEGLALSEIRSLTGKTTLQIMCEVDRLKLVHRTKSQASENGWLKRKFNKAKLEQLA